MSPRRDALDSGFNSLSRLSGSNPSAYRSGSSQLVDRGLDSSDSLMGLGSSVGNSDFIGARASTQWLEEQLRMRETQLAMTSSLLKEQTHLLSQVGSVLERRSAPLKRELPPAPQNQPYDFPKRFRSNYRVIVFLLHYFSRTLHLNACICFETSSEKPEFPTRWKWCKANFMLEISFLKF